MSALLTPEERNQHCYKVSTSPLRDEYLFSELDGTLNSGPFVRVDELLRHQVCKLILELEALEPFDHDTWNFGVAVRKWLKMTKAEVYWKETG